MSSVTRIFANSGVSASAEIRRIDIVLNEGGRIGLPDPDGTIEAGGRQPPTITAEADRCDGACMVQQREDLLSDLGIPNANGHVFPCGNKVGFSDSTISEREDIAGVTF